MDNELIEVQEKKLNIFQRIRMSLFKRQQFTMEKYIKAPDYIKEDDEVIDIIIRRNYLNGENLLQIPEKKLMERLMNNEIDIDILSLEKQIEFIEKNPQLAEQFGVRQANELIDAMIQLKKKDLISLLGYFQQTKYLKYLKENGTLNIIPDIIKYLSKGIRQQLVNQNSSLFGFLEEEQQHEYLEQNKSFLKNIDADMQLKYIQGNPEYIEYASDEALDKFILQDRDNLKKTRREFQIKTIAEHPNALEYASDEVKENIYNKPQNTSEAEIIFNLLKSDIRNSKYLDITNPQYYSSVFENIQNQDINTIKNMFLYSKILGAKGTLLNSNNVLHGTNSENVNGIDYYENFQIDIIKSLNAEQISELIKVDSNYILPYLTGTDYYHVVLNDKEKENSRARCKEVFINLFGEDKYASISQSIDIIYDMQDKKNESLKDSSKLNYATGSGKNEAFNKLRKVEDVPMDQFRIIFNKEIIENNTPEEIQAYLEKYRNGQPNSEEFKKLLENAYGSHVRKILDARPDFDVHSINSLEVFDKRIIDNFGEPFVNDLISYNIRDFSGFLDVVKDENRLSNFKTYYNVISKIMGKNVETMQRAISEFCYFEELLESANNVELTDKQYSNLISVLCSTNNRYNINTLQKLQNYEEIAYKMDKEELLKIEDTIRNMEMYKDIEPLKKFISERFLGIDYYIGQMMKMQTPQYRGRNYGDNFQYLTDLFDITTERTRKSVYDEAELKVLETMEFIKKTFSGSDVMLEQLFELANKLMEQQGIRNPIAVYSAIDKMKEHQIEILNESFLTVEKMEEACKQEEGKENPLITKTVREDGITEYSLEGLDFAFLSHDPYGMPLKDILKYDGQLGNSALCTRMRTSRSTKNISISGQYALGYTHVETNGLIAYSSADAGTNHANKLIRGTALRRKLKNRIDSNGGNEVAFYRRTRDHDLRLNDSNNFGGKRIPDILIAYQRNISLNQEELEIMKKYNIPIVYINSSIYREEALPKEKNEGER